MPAGADAPPARIVHGRWSVVLALCGCLVGGIAAAATSPTTMRHYALLETARARYEALAAQPALTVLAPLPRRSIRQGDGYAGTAALRTLLTAVGDLSAPAADLTPAAPADTVTPVLDPMLVAALRRFQERHGLEADGVLGPATWRALSTPLSARLRQIELTLQRWRGLPPNPHPRAIFINIPRFRLYAMHAFDDREASLLQMDVVVGRAVETLRTPTLAADLTHLVFRPSWDVPRSIILGELLPTARRDPQYFTNQRFELLDRAGKVFAYSAERLEQLADGTLRVRQQPGTHNALGAVKFVFPNASDVYLHDTPERTLFARTRRAFSHGCIRVADPAALAAWLLENDSAWTAERIAAAMDGTAPVRVNLPEPVRVYIVYGTAIAREDGSVLFLDDVYGLEKG
jgi:murein L,D-transpeptidase YcbB/YkuD